MADASASRAFAPNRDILFKSGKFVLKAVPTETPLKLAVSYTSPAGTTDTYSGTYVFHQPDLNVIQKLREDKALEMAGYLGVTVLYSASQVVAALEVHDGATLAALVHPVKGVRFSAYAWVDVDSDVRLSRAQVTRFWADRRVYLWGHQDGSGDPIEMTPSEYCRRYVSDRDFSRSTSISINGDRAYGNTVNNAAEAYPDSMRVEYYIPRMPPVRQRSPHSAPPKKRDQLRESLTRLRNGQRVRVDGGAGRTSCLPRASLAPPCGARSARPTRCRGS